jgi:uncharacterized protein YndB with AHSA1/START domain
MRIMLTTIIIAIAVIVVAILVFAATRPDNFRISRAITIDAPPESIFSLVNELRAHRRWSPFDQDAAMKRVYSGPDAGKGAMMEFDGGYKSGVGRFSIIDSAPPSRILMNLVMTKPLNCNNTVEFAFEPQGNVTLVTWSMYGPQTFAAKLMNVFIDGKKMCERQFDAGLASLKSLAESNRMKPAA